MSYRLGDATIKGTDNTVQVAFGDLNGDGIEEAAVNLTYTTGENKAFSKGFIYAIKDGKLQRVAEFDGILKAQITDGKLEVERCVVDEADNSLSIETTTYQLAESKLSALDKKKRKTNACL